MPPLELASNEPVESPEPERPDNPDEVVLASLLLTPEARAKRARRAKIGAGMLGALVAISLCAVFLAGRSEPTIEVVDLKPPPAPQPAPLEAVEDPLPLEADDEVSEPADDEDGTKNRKRRSGIVATDPAPDPVPGRAPYGPNVARYPDLPNRILTELEEAQTGRAKTPPSN
jgi:hypothetical protein